MNAFERFFRELRGDNEGANKEEEVQVESHEPDKVTELSKTIEGKIIKVSDEGWGFITSQEIPFTRIFFHWTSLVGDTKNFKELERNMHVEFVPVNKGPERGYHAIKIRVIEPKE